MVEPSQKSYFPRMSHSIQCAFYTILLYTIFFADLSHLILGSLRLFSLIPAS